MKVTIHAAKTNLSKLIEAAVAGEEVIISRGTTPVAQLVPVTPRRFVFGGLEAMLGEPPDFLAPMDAADLARWEGRP